MHLFLMSPFSCMHNTHHLWVVAFPYRPLIHISSYVIRSHARKFTLQGISPRSLGSTLISLSENANRDRLDTNANKHMEYVQLERLPTARVHQAIAEASGLSNKSAPNLAFPLPRTHQASQSQSKTTQVHPSKSLLVLLLWICPSRSMPYVA